MRRVGRGLDGPAAELRVLSLAGNYLAGELPAVGYEDKVFVSKKIDTDVWGQLVRNVFKRAESCSFQTW